MTSSGVAHLATLDDVAKLAGVSVSTASRVLNGSQRTVAEDYRAKVTVAAGKLGYAANLSAQATARGTSNLVSLIVGDIADPYFGQIAAGVTRRAAEVGMLTTIGVSGREPAEEVALFRTLRSQRPRAIILATSRIGAGLPVRLRQEIAAAQEVGCRVVVFGSGSDDLPTLAIDNAEGARALGRSLARRGYTSVVILSAPTGVHTSDDRVAGFSSGFEKAGGNVSHVLRGDFSREWGAQAMTDLLRDEVLPAGTLVFAVSDVIAMGAMAGIRNAGRRVGTDIAVAGFDDIDSARDVTPALTTVRIPLERIGYRALEEALRDEDSSFSVERVEAVLRESTPDRS